VKTLVKLHDFEVNKITFQLGKEDLKFLNLSGRKSFYTQGIYGQEVVLAVVDTGVSPHPELRGRLLPGRSFVEYTPMTFDDNGHGTHVAGSIAGQNVGIAPRANILPVKVLNDKGEGSLNNLIRGLEWVNDYRSRDGRKVNIVNMSLSVDTTISAEERDALHKVIKKLVDNNIAVIVSAGNTGKEEIRYPAAFDEVICVGAVDITRKRALFSTMGEHIDVCQIGVNVISLWHKGGYAVMSGTSMSTPLVSGIGALIASKYKLTFKENITEDYLWRSIKFNTKDLGIKGVDREYGTGFCTLQPLELQMVMKQNSPFLRVNEEIYRLERPAFIEDGSILLPGKFMGEITGAYLENEGDMIKYNY